MEQKAAPSYQPGMNTEGEHKRAHNLIIKSKLKHGVSLYGQHQNKRPEVDPKGIKRKRYFNELPLR